MNTSQLLALCIAIVLLILIGLFPPWKQTFQADGIASERPMGHALLLTPPEPIQDTRHFGVQVDVTRLVVMWLIVAGAAVGVIIALRWLPEKRSSSPTAAAAPAAPAPPASTAGSVQVRSATGSWRMSARFAYNWNQALLVLLVFGSFVFLFESLQWYAAVGDAETDATWIGINAVARGASLVYLFIARMKTTTEPYVAGWMILFYAVVMAGLGLIGVSMSSGRETAADETVYVFSNIQIGVAILAGLFTYPLVTERGQAFSNLLAYLEYYGVPTPWLTGNASHAFTLDPSQPHEKVKPFRILQAIAVGKLVVPADVRAAAQRPTSTTDHAVSP